jgi:bifunctional UDP-N-acetylglucosamine pyrophosphorylase/glucosamine-1-phosphate N-acetyltransferase
MKSALPKVLHPVANLPMLRHVLRTAIAAGGEAHAVIVGPGAQGVEAAARAESDAISVFTQHERKGTGHAVLAAREAIARGYDDILVLFGDTPLTRPETLRRMRRGLELGAEVAVLGFHADDPTGYGRLIERNGELVAIREHREASAEELAVNFCNGGIMAFGGANALSMLERIGNDNSKGEYYLTDLVEIARSDGRKVVAMEADEAEILGVNNRAELARAEHIWQQRRRAELLASGVGMQAPETVFLSHDTQIEPDAHVEPYAVFGPGVRVAAGVRVRGFSHLEDCLVEDDAIIGPFTRLRPKAHVGKGAHVGNFCEIKNARVEEGAKVNHLTYIGDARVGAGANVGAGTITCNYDGVKKHHTDIGKGAFIGSNSALVAPVSIGDGAYVASGSVVTDDIPADAMAIARGRQVNKPGRAAQLRERLKAAKD